MTAASSSADRFRRPRWETDKRPDPVECFEMIETNVPRRPDTAASGGSSRSAAKKPNAAKGSAGKSAARTAPKPKGRTKRTVPAKRAPAKRAPARRKPPKRRNPRSRKKGSRATSRGRKATSFKVNDKVVHPHHGAAVITKRLDQEVSGERQPYFELQVATEQLTVFVPVATIDQIIRPVISKTAATRVLRIFKDEPQASGKNWSRWYKVLNEKMTSGDIYQVAEVVRDLTHAQHVKGISPALKRMLSRARVTLTSELAFAFDISTEEATERLDNALPVPESADA